MTDGPRRLVIVLGDQLNRDSAAFDGFDPARDRVWMAEVEEEATQVPCHQQRLVLFFAAMRHFRDRLRSEGLAVDYHALSMDRGSDRGGDFRALLAEAVPRLQPERLVVVQPGDYRVQQRLQAAAADHGLPLEVRGDRHFYDDPDAFRRWADGRKGLVMEHFYRAMRKRHAVLMADGQPEGGQWNLDHANRESFGREGPGELPPLPAFAPDDTTRAVIETVRERFADHPGDARGFDLPVTPGDAGRALDHFIRHRLPQFGDYQDALWSGERFLYHSRLSAALNLHLLDPRDCVNAAVAAYREGRAPLNAVEGFVRQILGWREFIRGVYWYHMPDYAARNALGHDEAVPPLMWHGETDMACVADAMGNVLDHGYAHHIQRLMVLGLFAQLHGVHPYAFHEWHMAMYLDAVDWVSLPNTLGMSQFGDGGVVGTKPYCASGAYIQRMSNHCAGCRYDPRQAHGERACPFTTLYWAFLDRHAERFRDNRRMVFQIRNLDRRAAKDQLTPVLGQARELQARIRAGERV